MEKPSQNLRMVNVALAMATQAKSDVIIVNVLTG